MACQDEEECIEQGNTYSKKGEYDRAIEAYTQALTLNPEAVGAYTKRGIAYDNKGEYDRATR